MGAIKDLVLSSVFEAYSFKNWKTNPSSEIAARALHSEGIKAEGNNVTSLEIFKEL